jgi:hypothetical protein
MLQSLAGRRQTEQTNASPSLKDCSGGVKAICVSIALSFLSLAGLACFRAFRAMNTVK